MFFSKAKNKKSKKSPIWKTKNVMYDAALLPYIQKAEHGDCTSIRILAGRFFTDTGSFVLEKFSIGIWVKPNFDIARYYAEQIIEMHEQGTIDDRELYVYDLKLLAMIEAEASDYEKSQGYFIRAVHYMANELPPEQWDYDVFRLMNYSLYHFGYITKEEFEDKKW